MDRVRRAIGQAWRRSFFHDDTIASLLFGQHFAAGVVMERLCHAHISRTVGTYSHLIPKLNQEAAGAMDRALRG